MKKTLFIIITLSLVLSACAKDPDIIRRIEKSGGTPGQAPSRNQNIEEKLDSQGNIYKFESADELEDWLEENAGGTSGAYYGRGLAVEESFAIDGGAVMDAGSGEAAKMAAPRAAETTGFSNEAVQNDHSVTNVQVEGVDEADIVKTDGEFVYYLTKSNLFIIKAYPADQAEIVSKIDFKVTPQDIYISGDRLVIFGRDDQIRNADIYKAFRRRGSYTFFKVFDIGDKKNPRQVRDLDFEGSYLNSRLIGDHVFFITSNYQHFIDGEPILPRVIDGGEVLNACTSGEAEGCLLPDVYYFDIPYDNFNYTSVTAINIADDGAGIDTDVYLMSGAQNIYASLENLYISYTKYISEYELIMEVTRDIVFPRLSQKYQAWISEIDSAPNYILSKNEKNNKINQILERYAVSLDDEERSALEKEVEKAVKERFEDISKEMEKTVIHKVGIRDGQLEYKASGEVAGHVINQFAMDESGGYFRIATTKNRVWSRYMEDERSRESYNNLYILDSDLKQVGALEYLARGESIYSVRFMQNRAYMVTFKRVDPLFVIDLSDPLDPKVLGELKIPGFSNYLHPYDDNHLIGIGKDTAETEWGGVRTGGLKLSLFNVADVADPKEVDTYILGDSGSDSLALHDHKAFLFSREKNLLVIPVSVRESFDNRWGRLTFNGAAVFKVDTGGFELRGKLDHSDGGLYAEDEYWRGYSYYDSSVKRNLYINDVLYSFSGVYMKMHGLGGLDELGRLRLKKEKFEDFEVIN